VGLEPIVIEAGQPGAGASGNPAALVTPTLDAGGGPRARFYAQAFARAVDLYKAIAEEAVVAVGARQLERSDRDGARFDAVAAGDVFSPGALERIPGALRMTEGLVVRPGAVLNSWLGGAARLSGWAGGVERQGKAWTILDAEGAPLMQADVICIAAGAGAGPLLGQAAALTPVRGQASWADGLALDEATAWGGYAIPFDGAVLFGATHDRGRTDAGVEADDHARNLATLAEGLPALAKAAAGAVLQGRAAIRATTSDRLPIAGIVDDGLYVLGGLGSRGFTTAPLLAEHIAALIAQTPSPLPHDLQLLVMPNRLKKKAGR
jgi:tRNA 5-methylaminomethyl-2-thiouridine biosynthesis bifunctional protein